MAIILTVLMSVVVLTAVRIKPGVEKLSHTYGETEGGDPGVSQSCRQIWRPSGDKRGLLTTTATDIITLSF